MNYREKASELAVELEAEREKVRILREAARNEWESGCDCGTCDDCNLAYELDKRGLIATLEDGSHI